MDVPLLASVSSRRLILAGHAPKAALLMFCALNAVAAYKWSWGDLWGQVTHTAGEAAASAKHKAEEVANSSEAHRLEDQANKFGEQLRKAAQDAANSPQGRRAENATRSVAQHVRKDAEDAEVWFAHEARQALKSPAAAKAAEAFHRVEEKVKEASDSEQAAALRVAASKLAATVKAAFPKPPANFTVPKGCLVAMGVAAGVPIVASSSLSIRGFGVEGVAAKSLGALWQSLIGDVQAGSLFAKLQSLGAAGLTGLHVVRLSGASAASAFYFCEAADLICHHCIFPDE